MVREQLEFGCMGFVGITRFGPLQFSYSQFLMATLSSKPWALTASSLTNGFATRFMQSDFYKPNIGLLWTSAALTGEQFCKVAGTTRSAFSLRPVFLSVFFTQNLKPIAWYQAVPARIFLQSLIQHRPLKSPFANIWVCNHLQTHKTRNRPSAWILTLACSWIYSFIHTHLPPVIKRDSASSAQERADLGEAVNWLPQHPKLNGCRDIGNFNPQGLISGTPTGNS